jgi:hypothetical protein
MAAGLTFHIRIEGATETLAAFNKLSRDANKELRDETYEIADDVAGHMRGAAARDGAQSALMVPTIKARRDRVPNVSAGGGLPVGRYGKPAGALIFASEFGMSGRSGWYSRRRYRVSRGRQWHPHIGNTGYWFFPTARRLEPEVQRRWLAVADRLLRAWGAGG